MGDPLGIGPEVILKSLPLFCNRARFLIFGDPRFFATASGVELRAISAPLPEVYDELQAGRAVVASLDLAMEAYARGEIQALVTAPLSKDHVKRAGFSFPGHTEYLAAKTNTHKFAMMMAGPRLRVVLVTIHEPLERVPSLLNESRIQDTVELTWNFLRYRMGIQQPRIAVCGLNPHAGEKGHLGLEELEIIEPALVTCRSRGWECHGPVVPDAVFHEAYEGRWDAVVCMYHDQGLIPFKLLHFWEGVNVTLGLPLIRTSPDHGTAFDIAGRGIADPRSMQAAIRLALDWLERREET